MPISFPRQAADGTAIVEVDLDRGELSLASALTLVETWMLSITHEMPRTSPALAPFCVHDDLTAPPTVSAVGDRLSLRLHLRDAHSKGWKDWLFLVALPDLLRNHPQLTVGRLADVVPLDPA